MPLNGLFAYHFQCVMGIYFYYIGLKYIGKSTCYFLNAHISMKSYQLKHITFFNSSNNSYHFLSWWVAAVCLGLTDTVTKVKTNPSQKSQRYTLRRNGVPHPCLWLRYEQRRPSSSAAFRAQLTGERDRPLCSDETSDLRQNWTLCDHRTYPLRITFELLSLEPRGYLGYTFMHMAGKSNTHRRRRPQL